MSTAGSDRHPNSPARDFVPIIIRGRFEYKAAGLKAALVRVFKLPAPFEFPYQKAKHGGCRSWVDLPPALSALHAQAIPVLGDAEHAARIAEVRTIIGNQEPEEIDSSIFFYLFLKDRTIRG